MTRLRNNIIANFGGQAITVLLGVAFMPVYIRILGIEAYGLIGFYLSLQAFFGILDMGLSASLNRELARYAHTSKSPDEYRDLVRTLECIYWPAGGCIAVLVAAMSQPIATHWLNPVTLGSPETARAVLLMGIATAMQWPTALYGGGFRGLERQVTLNAISSSFSALRGVGSVFVLVYISATLEAFLWWQVGVGALQTLVCRAFLWRMLPPSDVMPRFRREILGRLRGFTLGMTGIAFLSFALMQSDRIILSAMLSLDKFGFYTVAATVAAVLASMFGPFFNALFPRYSGLVSSGDEATLIGLYHSSNQYLAVVVAPTAAVLACFSSDVLRLWTGNAGLADASGPVLSLLAVGTALNGLMHLPYALQLAYGWTRLALVQNVVAVLIVVPAIWWAAHRYGGIGAAAVWVALNLGYLTITIPIMHRRVLRNEMAAWYRRDILPPVLAATAVALSAKLVFGSLHEGIRDVFMLGLIGLAALCAAGAASPSARKLLFRHLAKLRA